MADGEGTDTGLGPGEPDVPEAAGFADDPGDQAGGDVPFFVEVWNDYDPSMRFVALFPVGEDQGATASSVAYYIIEPGRHSGVHSDNAEEVAFVAEGAGEVFTMGVSQPLEAGKFAVFPAGAQHDIYAHGSSELRLLSFFPTTEILSTFQQVVFPMGGNVVSSRPPRPVVTELDPDNLPDDFPFDLAELGLGPAGERELTMTERLIGMTKPGEPPPGGGVVITPGEEPEVRPAAGGPPAPAQEDGEGR